jgi:hypothetical protein
MTMDAVQDRYTAKEARTARIWGFKVFSGVGCCRSFAEHYDVMIARAVKTQYL